MGLSFKSVIRSYAALHDGAVELPALHLLDELRRRRSPRSSCSSRRGGGRSPARSAPTPATAGGTVPETACALEVVGDHHAVEAELAAQQALDDRRGEGGGLLGSERRVARRRDHHHPDAGLDRGLEGGQVVLQLVAASPRSVTALSSVLTVAWPSPGKCFAVATAPPSCRPWAKATPTVATVSGLEPKVRLLIVSAVFWLGDVQHRREVDVDAEASQEGARLLALVLGLRPRRRSCRGRPGEMVGGPFSIRFTSPPS